MKSRVEKLLCVVFLAGACLARARAAEFPFAEATIDHLQARMASGSLTARELTSAYLARIAAIDKSGPKLNAIIELNPDALALADQLDAERQAGRVRGALHGIPILIKDNIATADKMETTAGSLALVGAKPPRDAFLVTRLRAAGAVILGKTNLSEWANFRGERSISGWSARGGQTLNPYVLDRSPSGSSSGSAVAVAANLCVAAIGTETNGSIISPATACGVVGLKSTVGAVSRSGVIPIAASFDTAGPITRTVRDAALVLAALAGTDPRDNVTQDLPAGFAERLAAPWPAGALRGARIDVMLYEMKAGINAYLAELGPTAPMKTLSDVIKFNDGHWAKEQPLFGQQFFTRAQAKGPLTEPAYLVALEQCRQVSRTDGLDALMEKHRLDALVGGGPTLAAMAGYPSVTVPTASPTELPAGLLFSGPAWSEAKLLALAADFEARTHARREPRFVPTLAAP
ncbi:MAG: amidase family protein [Opitutaceae bacterium]